MSYVTNTDIEKRLGADAYVQLTDDDGDGVADAAVVDEARLGAEGEVNSYLARRYAVPIDLEVHAELAGLLTSITLDLVELRLRSRRPPVADDALGKAERAVDWLRRVADGGVHLPSVAVVASPSALGPVAATTGQPRVLTPDELADY